MLRPRPRAATTLARTFLARKLKRPARIGLPKVNARPEPIVEKGQPLLISNLDLEGMSSGGLTSYEFFKLFPEADRFQINTAVRMNATFPFISPTVDLPTTPPLSVVDAGYYDNYGLNIAVDYLQQPRVLEWLKNNSAGVMIIELIAFPNATEDAWRPDCAEKDKTSKHPIVADAFSWLTAPIEAASNAREAGMSVRNEKSLQLLKTIYGTGFIETVTFTLAARASMSWYVPEAEFECLEAGLLSDQNMLAMDKLQEFWKVRSGKLSRN